MQQPSGRLDGDAVPQSAGGATAPVDVRREEGVVALGEHRGRAVAEAEVVGSVRREPGGATPRVVHRAHREDVGTQVPPDGVEDGVEVGSGPVDLVDEQQGRDVQPLEGAHQDPGLGLHALDGREHEHRSVEDDQ